MYTASVHFVHMQFVQSFAIDIVLINIQLEVKGHKAMPTLLTYKMTMFDQIKPVAAQTGSMQYNLSKRER